MLSKKKLASSDHNTDAGNHEVITLARTNKQAASVERCLYALLLL